MGVSHLFFFNDTATTEIYTLSLHDALPISLPCDGGRNERSADQGFLEAGQQVRRELGLEDITQGPGSERSIHVVRVRVHGQEYDPRRGTRRLEFPGCLDAVQHGHGDVEHDHVGLEPGGFVHQRLPVANGLEHLEMRFEMSSDGSEEVTMVIGQEYAHTDGPRSWSIRGPNAR